MIRICYDDFHFTQKLSRNTETTLRALETKHILRMPREYVNATTIATPLQLQRHLYQRRIIQA